MLSSQQRMSHKKMFVACVIFETHATKRNLVIFSLGDILILLYEARY